MKRTLCILATICLVSPAMAAHFNCTSASACASAPCNWAAAGSWDSCNSTYPFNTGGNTYTASIGSGHTVILATDALTIGLATQTVDALTLNGTLKFSDSSSGRSTELFRTLTLVPDSGSKGLTMGSSAVLDIPASSRLFCDTTTVGCDMTLANTVNIYGTVVDATLTAVAAATTNALCDGGTESMYIAVTVDSGQDNAKVGRRIRFKSGAMRNREFEIVAVSAKTIGICTYLPDATPTTDLTCDTGTIGRTCGQRLTPHSAVGKFPDATPSANTRHWTPAPAPGNSICAAAFDPLTCCTGANAGTCNSIAPEVGDQVSIIDDVWLGDPSSNQRGVAWSMTNSLKMPRLYAVNMFGMNGMAINSQGLGSETPQNIEYINWHDPAINAALPSPGALGITGFKNYAVRYSTFHDDASTSTGAYGTLSPVCSGAALEPCPDNLEVTDNAFYRSLGNDLNILTAATTVSVENVSVLRNLVFEGCTRPDNEECHGLEINGCVGCKIRNNVVYDKITVDDSNPATVRNGAGIRMGAASGAAQTISVGSDVSRNWIVNMGHTGILLNSTNGYAGYGIGVTGNYVANVGRQLFAGGTLYGNVGRNCSMISTANPCSQYTRGAYSNFILGNESNMATYCSGLAAGCSYAPHDMTYSATYYVGTSTPITVSDNVFSRTNYAGGLCSEIGGAMNNSLVYTHNICDSTNGGGLQMNAWDPTAAFTATITDNAFTHLNNAAVVYCDGNANVTDTVGFYLRNLSPTTAETTAAPNTSDGPCSASGTVVTSTGAGYINRALLDYNYSPYAPGLTGASNGSALGARVFRFDRDAIDDLWGNSLPWDLSVGDPTGATLTTFPKNICDNGESCLDTDGDGVMNLHDNCDLTPNPAQYDGDSDGKGCACDASGDTCP